MLIKQKCFLSFSNYFILFLFIKFLNESSISLNIFVSSNENMNFSKDFYFAKMIYPYLILYQIAGLNLIDNITILASMSEKEKSQEEKQICQSNFTQKGEFPVDSIQIQGKREGFDQKINLQSEMVDEKIEAQVSKGLGSKQNQQIQSIQELERSSKRQKSFHFSRNVRQQNLYYVNDDEQYYPEESFKKAKKITRAKEKTQFIANAKFMTKFINNVSQKKAEYQQKIKKEEQMQERIALQKVRQKIDEYQYQGHIITEPYINFNITKLPNLLKNHVNSKQQDHIVLKKMRNDVFKNRTKKMGKETYKKLPNSMRVSSKIYLLKFIKKFDEIYQKLGPKGMNKMQEFGIINQNESCIKTNMIGIREITEKNNNNFDCIPSVFRKYYPFKQEPQKESKRFQRPRSKNSNEHWVPPFNNRLGFVPYRSSQSSLNLGSRIEQEVIVPCLDSTVSNLSGDAMDEEFPTQDYKNE